MEGKSKCSSICIVNDSFKISSNEITEKSKPRSIPYKVIREVIKYLNSIINKTNTDEDKDEILKYLAPYLIKSNFGKCMKYVEEIVETLIDKKVNLITLDDIQLFNLGIDSFQLIDAHVAKMFLLKLSNKIFKIQEFLNSEDSLKENINYHTAIKNFSSKNDILKVKKGCHSELKIVEWLISNGTKGDIYIGISKKACIKCKAFIDKCNEILYINNKALKFQFGGYHEGYYDKWEHPTNFHLGFYDYIKKTRKKKEDVEKMNEENKLYYDCG
jgi:hypothetical protein